MQHRLNRRLGILAILLFMTVKAVFAQDTDTIRMMHYNLMYYTNSSGISDCNSLSNNLDTKDANIKTIFQYVKPTVFCVCEIGSQNQYADRLLNNAINTDGIDYYRRGPLTNQSGGTIANMIYYDSRKLTLYKATNITTSYRDINGYTFYYNANNLGAGDTIFMTFWLAHLKSGSNSSNEEARLAQVQKLMSRITNSGLPGNYTLSGDFNIYSSDEPAYQMLTEYPNSLYRFYDPINSPGYWHNNPQFSMLHTQSTHTQEADCFSNGGLDDRFDFILVSPYIYYGSDRLHVVEGSYHVLGQDGVRFNGSILSPINNSIPSNVTNALYHQSDHLPVIMDMTIDAHVGVPVLKPDFQVAMTNPVRETLKVSLQNNEADDYDICIYATDGSLVMKRHERLDVGFHHLTYPFSFRKGIYLVAFTNKSGKKHTQKLIHY